jgi:NifU-like protein
LKKDPPMLDLLEASSPTESAAEPRRTRIVSRDVRPAGAPAAPKPVLRPAVRLEGPELRAAVAEAIEELRPRLQRDGGDCELVDIVDDIVRVRLTGACVGCQLASMTLVGVRMRLTEKLGFLVKVAPV